MHAAIRPYAEHVSSRLAGVALRVGLDSGEVVVRTTVDGPVTGPYGDRSGRPCGDPAPAVRARLDHVGGPGDRPALRGVHSGSSRQAGPGGGLSEVAGAFELVGVQPPRSRFQRVVGSRPLTPFVGRDVELASLTPTLGRARAGRGQIVAVVGEAGVGKSRLVWECARSDQTDGWRTGGRGRLLRCARRPTSRRSACSGPSAESSRGMTAPPSARSWPRAP